MDKIYIFSNGTEAYDWIENNCRNCSQYGEDHESTACPMAKEIDLGFIGADNFTTELIEPYGFKPLGPPARCKQFNTGATAQKEG